MSFLKLEFQQVNVDGETYPVGFFIGNWAAGYAANVMAAILTEEQWRQITDLILLQKTKKKNLDCKLAKSMSTLFLCLLF